MARKKSGLVYATKRWKGGQIQYDVESSLRARKMRCVNAFQRVYGHVGGISCHVTPSHSVTKQVRITVGFQRRSTRQNLLD